MKMVDSIHAYSSALHSDVVDLWIHVCGGTININDDSRIYHDRVHYW